MNNIQTFWTWFKSRSDYIYHNLENDTDNIALEITEHLKVISDDLAFEIPIDFDGELREFILSADGLIELFDLVIDLVEKAPILNKWKITAFRPRLHQRNQIIDLDGITMDYGDVFFTYKVLPKSIEIEVYLNNYDGKDNRYVHLYFLLLDSLIGEFDSVKYISATKVNALKDKNDLQSFPELLHVIEELKNK